MVLKEIFEDGYEDEVGDNDEKPVGDPLLGVGVGIDSSQEGKNVGDEDQKGEEEDGYNH